MNRCHGRYHYKVQLHSTEKWKYIPLTDSILYVLINSPGRLSMRSIPDYVTNIVHNPELKFLRSMNKRERNNLTSKSISILRFPLTIGVVFIHFSLSKGLNIHGTFYGINNPDWFFFCY